MCRKMPWLWGVRGRRSRKGGARRGVTRSRASKSGCFRAGLFGKPLVQADASRKAGAHDLGFGDVEQAADHCRRVAFYVAKQEKQTLVGREVVHCHFKVWTANIAAVEPGPGNQDGGRFFFA